MSTFNATLHPRGHASNAGAFSEKTQSDAEVTLEAGRDWGTLNIAEGSRTPWGSADWVTEMGPGVVSVSTPGHGGVKLSKERNAVIPPALRRTWYEEDCEVNIVGMYHPEVFTGGTTEEQFEAGVKRWFPDEYEKATGNTVTAEESPIRAEKLFGQAHENDFVAQHHARIEETPGFVRLIASKAATGETIDFLVPVEEQAAQLQNPALGQSYRIVVDETKHARATPKVEPEKIPATKYTTITEPKTDTARALLEKDLRKRYNFGGGKIRSLAEVIEDGVSGKSAYVENGKRTYSLQLKEYESDSSYSSLPVTKATFDAVGAPDSRTPAQIDRQAADIAFHAYENRGYGFEEGKRLRARYNAASEKASASWKAEEDARKAGI